MTIGRKHNIDNLSMACKAIQEDPFPFCHLVLKEADHVLSGCLKM